MSETNFKDIVRRVKEETDLVELIGQSVSLKRVGNSFTACCPFHKEKTPSFKVHPDKGFFFCFGCGAKGSAIDYVMRTENLEFIEATEKLATALGLALPKSSPEDRARRDEVEEKRHAILSANEAATKWFRAVLKKKLNPIANAYLPERGLGEELVEQFQIGATPDSWDGLKQHLINLGFSEGLLVESGLCRQSESGRVYDAFRNRLMFPIHDVNGRPIAFGGRQLVKDENSGKYINSQETELYKKGHHLYALDIARDAIMKAGYAILCEGYMDVIMAHAHGFNQAVASLGTALTPMQARLLKRFASKTFFLYDGDLAGRDNMLKGGIPLLAAGFDTRVVILPEGDDPDTFLRRDGHDALKERLNTAPEFFDWAMDVHDGKVDLATLAGQAEFTELMAPIINALKNDVMREGALKRLLERLGGLPREAVTRILKKHRQDQERREERSDYPQSPASRTTSGEQDEEAPTARRLPHQMVDPLERSLLKLMIESNEALETARSNLRHEWITDRRLEGWIFYFRDSGGYAKTLIEEIEFLDEQPGDGTILFSVMAWELSASKDAAASMQEILLRLQERHQQAHTREILGMLDDPALTDQDRERILTVFHMEHRTRLKESSRHLRTRDAAARRHRLGGNLEKPGTPPINQQGNP
ncbi:MAG: DNA primase [Candidatus Sumerlaeia bacterium]|nr:DNA primase [Candidatus Sumerlaeia bacterium]